MNKKLYRSRKDKMIGGVAGGLAEYFHIDPTIIRVLFIMTLFMGGSGILAYIILWIVVPEEPLIFPGSAHSGGTSEPNSREENSSSSGNPVYPEPSYYDHPRKGTNAAGVILIIIGFLFLADNIFPHIHFGDFWPLILIAIGIGILLNSKK